MSQSASTLATLRLAAAPVAANTVRAPGRAAPATSCAPRLFIATINPLIGDTGVQTHTRSLHDGLAADGIACDVVTPFSGTGRWLPIFALRKLIAPINKSWSTRWYRHWHAAALRQALARALRDARTHSRAGSDASSNFVLAQCPVSAAAALEVRARYKLNFPIAMVCHFNFSEAKEYRDKGELGNETAYQAALDFERRTLGSVDRVIYVSSWARRVVEKERRMKVRASSVIWNGIAATGAVAISRAEIGLRPENLVLMNVGTLEKRKNQLGLIDLFAAVVKVRPEARLVLVGDGPQRPEIRKRIDEQGLTAKVRMLGMRRDVPALLGAADLYVHYADLENCPVVLLEAARAALPIAAVPSGGVPELLEILGGASLEPNDIAQSLSCLRPLIDNRAERRRAGDAARMAFEQTFTREAMVAAYLEAMQVPLAARREVSP